MTIANSDLDRALKSLESHQDAPLYKESFQERNIQWAISCFGERVLHDPLERRHRFLEEAIELVQATGYTRDDAYDMVDYVFNRPVGEPKQEVGGVMVTLAALCTVHGIDMMVAAENELASAYERIEKIRAKAAAKRANTALPGGAGKSRSQRIKELEEENQRLRDYGGSASKAAREILNYLGRGCDPSDEPGADRHKDFIAAIIDKTLLAANNDLSVKLADAEMTLRELRAAGCETPAEIRARVTKQLDVNDFAGDGVTGD